MIFNSHQSYFAVSFPIYPVVLSFLCQIPSQLMFISWSPVWHDNLQPSSFQSRLWIALGWIQKQHNTPEYMLRSHRRLFYTAVLAVYLYPSRTPQQSDLAVYLLVDSLETHGQASLWMQLLIADDRFFFVSNSEQHSLAGTQQYCAQIMLVSACHLFICV